MSRGALARRIGRSREEVQRWTSEREQIPRHHLAEIAVQLGCDSELDHVMQLKTGEELANRLVAQLKELARRAGCTVEQLKDNVFRVIAARAADELTLTDTERATIYVHHLIDAQFVIRLWLEAAVTGEFTGMIAPINIDRHLRYPSNHFFGLVLDLGGPLLPAGHLGHLAELRLRTLAGLRTLAESRPTDGSEELARHHAIHILARHGQADDRAIVHDIIADARSSTDPLATRLGYMGLIMNSGDPETIERYTAMLRRDPRLLRADLTFDAVHYGDAKLDRSGHLPETVSHFERSIGNILRHLERPDQYAPIAELDSLRLLHVMDRTGSAAFGRPGVALRLRRICEGSPQPLSGSFRHQLELRVIALSDHISYHRHSHEIGPAELKTPDEYDVFIGYNSRDHVLVRPVVEALRTGGVRTWMDRMDLPPGTLFQDKIEDVLRSCRSAAMFVGPDGVGPWERLEIKAAISQFVARGLPVIPVMLDGTGPEPMLPLFLREFRMVRFRSTKDLSVGVDELVWGITGSRQPRIALT